MAEAVRLVIWDLDETFWKGTITEGGVSEYIQENHDIVIELARRGIISSICSKNDEAPTLAFLNERGIREYFVFPSISWEPKGARLAAMIEAIGLRPATCMFIDDNPSNRGEAAAFLPDLQIEDETFIPRLLADPRFKGKDDSGLSRLKQYQVLEQRKADEIKSGADNTDFLRGCDIRVYIEHDVEGHIDRAIELINRTNQLNFTKRRLPEEIGLARDALRSQMGSFRCVTGLVRVADRYGDYGFVGFFLLNGDPPTAVHYCFSCRTLGMKVEKWLYDRLGRPALRVKGDVLTDLFDQAPVDWVRLTTSSSEERASTESVAPEIRLIGGCEAQPIAHYFRAYCPEVKVLAAASGGPTIVSHNAIPLFLSACDRAGPEFQAEAGKLEIPYEILVSDFLSGVPEGCCFVFAKGSDDLMPWRIRYRHKTMGWELRADPQGFQKFNVFDYSDTELTEKIDAGTKPEFRTSVLRFARHIRENYDCIQGDTEASVKAHTASLLARIPVGSKIVFILDSPRIRVRQDEVHIWKTRAVFNRFFKTMLEAIPYAAAVDFDDIIENDKEVLQGGNHFDRKVYLRMSEAVVAALRALPPKTSEAALLDAAD
jgi:FkbH-like protein